jgi:hypothetical protein
LFASFHSLVHFINRALQIHQCKLWCAIAVGGGGGV